MDGEGGGISFKSSQRKWNGNSCKIWVEEGKSKYKEYTRRCSMLAGGIVTRFMRKKIIKM